MKFRDTGLAQRRVRATVDMTPLIDVVFLLLIFFMLSATFVVQNSIHVQLPRAEGTKGLEQKDITVTITAEAGGPEGTGKLYVNRDEMPTWEALTRRLSDEAARRENPRLLLRADEHSPVGLSIRVLGIASRVGITRYGFGAQPLEDN